MTLSRNARRDIYRTNVQMISGVIVNGTLTYFMFGMHFPGGHGLLIVWRGFNTIREDLGGLGCESPSPGT